METLSHVCQVVSHGHYYSMYTSGIHLCMLMTSSAGFIVRCIQLWPLPFHTPLLPTPHLIPISFHPYTPHNTHHNTHTTHKHSQTHHTHHNTHTHTTSPVGGKHSKDIICNPRPNEGGRGGVQHCVVCHWRDQH